jgi:hypothetical protein
VQVFPKRPHQNAIQARALVGSMTFTAAYAKTPPSTNKHPLSRLEPSGVISEYGQWCNLRPEPGSGPDDLEDEGEHD